VEELHAGTVFGGVRGADRVCRPAKGQSRRTSRRRGHCSPSCWWVLRAMSSGGVRVRRPGRLVGRCFCCAAGAKRRAGDSVIQTVSCGGLLCTSHRRGDGCGGYRMLCQSFGGLGRSTRFRQASGSCAPLRSQPFISVVAAANASASSSAVATCHVAWLTGCMLWLREHQHSTAVFTTSLGGDTSQAMSSASSSQSSASSSQSTAVL
jgi:hypothetical protein